MGNTLLELLAAMIAIRLATQKKVARFQPVNGSLGVQLVLKAPGE